MSENAGAPPDLPTGVELEAAITEAKAGRLGAEEFGVALTTATLLMAVTSQPGDEAVAPFVLSVEGIDYGVTFTSPRQFEQSTVQTPFVLLPGASLRDAWPAGLGLAINPGGVPTILFAPAQLAQLVRGGAPRGAEGDTVVPSGTPVRVGAPDPGLPDAALDLLRRLVRSDPDVAAAYQLAVAVGDDPVELAVGVEAAEGRTSVAQRFGERVVDADAGFRGIAFFDLDGVMLGAAREHGRPLA